MALWHAASAAVCLGVGFVLCPTRADGITWVLEIRAVSPRAHTHSYGRAFPRICLIVVRGKAPANVGTSVWWMAQFIVNPKPFLADLVGKVVRVRLKWGMEYQGKLASSDAYMNLQLLNTEEFIDGELAGFLGEVLVRCNNVLYIKASENQEDTGVADSG